MHEPPESPEILGIGPVGRESNPVIAQLLHTVSQYRMLRNALEDIDVGLVRRDVQRIEKESGGA